MTNCSYHGLFVEKVEKKGVCVWGGNPNENIDWKKNLDAQILLHINLGGALQSQ